MQRLKDYLHSRRNALEFRQEFLTKTLTQFPSLWEELIPKIDENNAVIAEVNEIMALLYEIEEEDKYDNQ